VYVIDIGRTLLTLSFIVPEIMAVVTIIIITLLGKMRKDYMTNWSFEVSMAVIFQMMVFWVVTTWNLVDDTNVSESTRLPSSGSDICWIR
jgi:hypothetical protein